MEDVGKRTKGPVCGIENCRSRIYEQGEDGYLYCQNGHRKGSLVTAEDEADFSTARRTTTRKKTDHDERKVYKYYKGQQALDLYLKSLQLVLRHQVWFLIHEKNLPEELETVVLDLWALRILKLEPQISDVSGQESQSQTFSATQSESESEVESKKLASHEKKLKVTPTLLDSLALCYLGVMTLRLPVTPGDIRSWVVDQKMPYMRAIKYIPQTMRDKLPSYYHATLDPNSLLKYERFYSTVTDLEIALEKEYGIAWPKLNHPLLLFRYLKDLALPLELYDATIRLLGYLNYDLTLPRSDKGKIGIRQLPEAQLAACLVVCIKLMYPFDGLKRYPKTISEPATTVIDWDDWQMQISSLRESHKSKAKAYTSEDLYNVEEKDVFGMSDNQLDQYLDWYALSFIDESVLAPQSEYQQSLYDLFPIDRLPDSIPLPRPHSPSSQDRLDVVKSVHGNFKPRRVITEENEESDTARPGDTYRYWRKVEDLPESAKNFYVELGKVAGLSVEMLVLAVFFAEKGVQRWMNKQKREARENSSSNQ